MSLLLDIPEIRCLDGQSSLIRIPSQIDVPVTSRLMRIIDTPAFQRLTRISQLGMVSFVYPAANHNRFEHSLGVYRNSLLFLRQLASQADFTQAVSPSDAEALILAALLHDIGHWPYCHPIEDISLDGLPTHESLASYYLNQDAIRKAIAEDWNTTVEDVLDIINKNRTTPTKTLLCSILSGPIDIDKMDYLYRDSLHAGVPYGQNFDSLRLMRSLCLNESGDRLAITRKGRTAAELMVFARYVMFSEVYWHHAVRSATAIFQRAFYLWHQSMRGTENFSSRLLELFQQGESEMISELRDTENQAVRVLLDRLFGNQRRLYKCAASFSCDENEPIYRQVAQKPYPWLVATSNQMTERLNRKLAQPILPHEILIDAPPVGLEVQFNVDVRYPESGNYRRLGDVSPVVKTLAQRQFDDFVKQVRIFVAPEHIESIKNLNVENEFLETLQNTDPT